METLKATHLYQYIQSFLTSRDYLALMDCNHEIFSQIKRETMKYYLKEKNVDDKKMIQTFLILSKIRKLVDCPSKQISLKLFAPLPHVLNTVHLISSTLHTLEIDTNSSGNYAMVDFSVFDNIPVVSLTGFNGVQNIRKGLKNIQHLTLSMNSLRTVYDFNESNSLKSFTLEAPVLTDGVNSSKSLMQIDSLDWECSGESYANFPIGFTGTELYLSNFSLITAWQPQIYRNNIQYLVLDDCLLIEELPSMPELRYLSLVNISGLRSLRTFPCCKFLKLQEMNGLSIVAAQPVLKHLSIQYSYISEHSFDGHVFRHVDVTAFSVLDFSWIRNSYYFWITTALPDGIFDGYNDNLLIPGNERTFVIDYNEENVDLTPLSNIERVVLKRVVYFGIHSNQTTLSNLNELMIYSCSNYEITNNIQNIRNSLVICNCEALTTIVNLQGIPRIVLCVLPEVMDFYGLGKNEIVYVYQVPVIEHEARRYATEKKSNMKVTSRYSYNFETIKLFSIITEISFEDKYRYLNGFDWKLLESCKQDRLW